MEVDTTMRPDAVRLRNVSVLRGGRRVVDDFTTMVPAGCGKSTLMRSIVGVQENVEGSITVLGHPAGDPWLRPRAIPSRSRAAHTVFEASSWTTIGRTESPTVSRPCTSE